MSDQYPDNQRPVNPDNHNTGNQPPVYPNNPYPQDTQNSYQQPNYGYGQNNSYGSPTPPPPAYYDPRQPYGQNSQASGQPYPSYGFPGAQGPDAEEIDGVPAYEVGAFVQNNAHFYIPKFKKMSQTGSKVSWNWPAFFFPDYWMLYRRMIKPFFIYLLVMCLITIPFLIFEFSNVFNSIDNLLKNLPTGTLTTDQLQNILDSISNMVSTSLIYSVILLVLGLAIRIFFGLFSNYIYYRHTMKKIATVTAPREDSYKRSYMLKAAGGTKVSNPFIYLGISFAIGLILGIIISALLIPYIMNYASQYPEYFNYYGNYYNYF